MDPLQTSYVVARALEVLQVVTAYYIFLAVLYGVTGHTLAPRVSRANLSAT